MTSIVFTIPGKPVPKQRARAGAGGRFYTPGPTRKYERAVHLCALDARQKYMAEHGFRHAWPLDARYSIEALATWGDARPRDLDNLLKSLCDGGNGVLWKDDSQIDRKTISRTLPEKAPRCVVRVTVLPAPSLTLLAPRWGDVTEAT